MMIVTRVVHKRNLSAGTLTCFTYSWPQSRSHITSDTETLIPTLTLTGAGQAVVYQRAAVAAETRARWPHCYDKTRSLAMFNAQM